jgi:hypothetical protein
MSRVVTAAVGFAQRVLGTMMLVFYMLIAGPNDSIFSEEDAALPA